jgi:hypothetical protein
VEDVTLSVEELSRTLLQADLPETRPGIAGAVDYVAVLYVAEFKPHHSAAAPHLNVFHVFQTEDCILILDYDPAS